MTGTPPTPEWTDRDLDRALADLAAGYRPGTADIARLRQRIMASPNISWRTYSPQSSRRPNWRRGALTAGIVLVCGVGGVTTAAALGVFSDQTQTAFARGNTYPYNINPRTAIERVATSTPDGGSAQYWTAKEGNARCGAVLLDDPGVMPAGKPYRPQATCQLGADPIEEQPWESAKTGKHYVLEHGRVDENAVAATFTNPINHATVTVTPHAGYYLAFLPALPTPPGGSYGLIETRADGSTVQLRKPAVDTASIPVPSAAHALVTIPNLVGKTEQAADIAAATAGITTLVVHHERNALVGQGLVISTNPPAGTQIPSNQGVTVFVSTGP